MITEKTTPSRKRDYLQDGMPRKDGTGLRFEQGSWIFHADNKDLISILDNLPCGVAILGSPLGNALYINRQIVATLGYSLPDTPSTRAMWRKAIPDQKMRRDVAESWKQAVKAGGGTLLIKLLCGDGEIRTFENKPIVLRKDLIISMWIDVTRREEAEARLAESESRFRSFFEKSTDPFLLFDGNRVINCNFSAQQMFQYSTKEQMIGATLEDLSPEKQPNGPLSSKKARTLFRVALKQGNHRSEWTIRRSDGKEIPVELSTVAIMLEGKNLLFVVLRDITPWKEAQAVLVNAKAELENAVRKRTAELVALNEDLRNSREELRHLSEHLQRAREDERIRIAREVHDDVGQLLTGLKMNLVYQTQNPPHKTAVQLEETEGMIEQIDGAIHRIQEICSKLRPAILGHFGLTAAVRWYLEEFEKRTGIHCRTRIDSEFPVLDKESDTLLFRIFQEVMTNVVRHARATKVTVRLKREEDNVVFTIKDNGRGILKEEIMHPRSFGIIGIRERVHFRGGRSNFWGAPNKGTTVTVRLPLNRNYASSDINTAPGKTNGGTV